MHGEIWQWLLAGGCALLAGMAKTGVPGLGILVVPLMLLAVPEPKLSTGTTLGILCVADLFAVIYYRRHAHWDRLLKLSPWVAIGLALGMAGVWAVDAWRIDQVWFTRLIGLIVLAMIALHVARRFTAAENVPRSWWIAALFGVIAGFATTVANAAGPVMNLYLLSMALPKEEFMGTGAWFFCIINLVKVPLFCPDPGVGCVAAARGHPRRGPGTASVPARPAAGLRDHRAGAGDPGNRRAVPAPSAPPQPGRRPAGACRAVTARQPPGRRHRPRRWPPRCALAHCGTWNSRRHAGA